MLFQADGGPAHHASKLGLGQGGGRHLLLKAFVTDGLQQVVALDLGGVLLAAYQQHIARLQQRRQGGSPPVPTIFSFLVGAKIVLRNVLVRRGALVLTKETAQVLGGSVARLQDLSAGSAHQQPLGLEHAGAAGSGAVAVIPASAVAVAPGVPPSAVVSANSAHNSSSTSTSISMGGYAATGGAAPGPVGLGLGVRAQPQLQQHQQQHPVSTVAGAGADKGSGGSSSTGGGSSSSSDTFSIFGAMQSGRHIGAVTATSATSRTNRIDEVSFRAPLSPSSAVLGGGTARVSADYNTYVAPTFDLRSPPAPAQHAVNTTAITTAAVAANGSREEAGLFCDEPSSLGGAGQPRNQHQQRIFDPAPSAGSLHSLAAAVGQNSPSLLPLPRTVAANVPKDVPTEPAANRYPTAAASALNDKEGEGDAFYDVPFTCDGPMLTCDLTISQAEAEAEVNVGMQEVGVEDAEMGGVAGRRRTGSGGGSQEQLLLHDADSEYCYSDGGGGDSVEEEDGAAPAAMEVDDEHTALNFATQKMPSNEHSSAARNSNSPPRSESSFFHPRESSPQSQHHFHQHVSPAAKQQLSPPSPASSSGSAAAAAAVVLHYWDEIASLDNADGGAGAVGGGDLFRIRGITNRVVRLKTAAAAAPSNGSSSSTSSSSSSSSGISDKREFNIAVEIDDGHNVVCCKVSDELAERFLDMTAQDLQLITAQMSKADAKVLQRGLMSRFQHFHGIFCVCRCSPAREGEGESMVLIDFEQGDVKGLCAQMLHRHR